MTTQDIRDDYKALELSWNNLKDDYSEICRALGFDGDSWFNDPLIPHKEIVARAKFLTLQEQRHKEEMKNEKDRVLADLRNDLYQLKGDLMYVSALKDVEDIINKKIRDL